MKVRPASPEDLLYIDDLQRKNAEQLSFYPNVVFEREVLNGRIILAEINNEPAGYLYHGAFGPFLKIHQACIQYDIRGQLYGAEIVRSLLGLAESAGVLAVTLRCGSDIDANHFWQAMGFYCEAVVPGGVRRMRDINCWRRDISEPLFKVAVESSNKEQNASLWRANKMGDNSSQFLRGKALREYREKLEKMEAEK